MNPADAYRRSAISPLRGVITSTGGLDLPPPDQLVSRARARNHRLRFAALSAASRRPVPSDSNGGEASDVALLARVVAHLAEGTDLSPADHQAFSHFSAAILASARLEQLLHERQRDVIADRLLHLDDRELVLSVLWRAPDAGPRAYGVGVARCRGGKVRLIPEIDGWRVDNAWPYYQLITWA